MISREGYAINVREIEGGCDIPSVCGKRKYATAFDTVKYDDD